MVETRMRVAVVGSGFAGSILARVLNAQGHDVLLVEQGRHPRFALGESSTPLAAIGLERLATRYGLADLRHLAAYGRWLEHMPAVRRGLKRGFTFYAHTPGKPFGNSLGNEHRLLVAASPDDAVADTHWLRADVDAFLVERACDEGVEYLDRTRLTHAEQRYNGWRLSGMRGQERVGLRADAVLDASGPNGFLTRALELPPGSQRHPLDTGLVYSHFEGVGDFPAVARRLGAELAAGPYPDERAAVHHLIDEGWVYVLPFDHGVVSAGIVYEKTADSALLETRPADQVWRDVMRRYPTLEAQFADAQPLRAIARTPRLQHRCSRPAGHSWALLPHAFSFASPMFSTGIAWSVVAVERLGLVFGSLTTGGAVGRARLQDGLSRYGRVLDLEADHLERLISGAYRTRHDFDRFVAYSQLYFAAASFAEASQRLLAPPTELRNWAWDGVLGATDPGMQEALERAHASLIGPPCDKPTSSTDALSLVADLVRARNVAGLADPGRNRLYPVDLEALVAHAGLLGLSREAVVSELPRLRGAVGTPMA